MNSVRVYKDNVQPVEKRKKILLLKCNEDYCINRIHVYAVKGQVIKFSCDDEPEGRDSL